MLTAVALGGPSSLREELSRRMPVNTWSLSFSLSHKHRFPSRRRLQPDQTHLQETINSAPYFGA